MYFLLWCTVKNYCIIFSPVSCLDVNTNGTVKDEPAPAPETLRVDKEATTPPAPPPHVPPPPPPERTADKEKDKNERDKTGMMAICKTAICYYYYGIAPKPLGLKFRDFTKY